MKQKSHPQSSPRTHSLRKPQKIPCYKELKYQKLPEIQHFCCKYLKVMVICFILQCLGVLGVNFPQGTKRTVQAVREVTNTSSPGQMQLAPRFRVAPAEQSWLIWGVTRSFSSRASPEHLIIFKEIKCYSLLPSPHAKLGYYLQTTETVSSGFSLLFFSLLPSMSVSELVRPPHPPCLLLPKIHRTQQKRCLSTSSGPDRTSP